MLLCGVWFGVLDIQQKGCKYNGVVMGCVVVGLQSRSATHFNPCTYINTYNHPINQPIYIIFIIDTYRHDIKYTYNTQITRVLLDVIMFANY